RRRWAMAGRARTWASRAHARGLLGTWPGGDARKRRMGVDLSPKAHSAAEVTTLSFSLHRSGDWLLTRCARRRLSALARALGAAGGAVGGRRGRVLAEGCVPSHQRGSSPIQCSGFTWISAAMRPSFYISPIILGSSLLRIPPT